PLLPGGSRDRRVSARRRLDGGQGLAARLVDLEVAFEPRDLEQRAHAWIRRDDRQRAAAALAQLVEGADELCQRRRVDERGLAQVDDQAAAAGADRLQQPALERWRGLHVNFARDADYRRLPIGGCVRDRESPALVHIRKPILPAEG